MCFILMVDILGPILYRVSRLILYVRNMIFMVGPIL